VSTRWIVVAVVAAACIFGGGWLAARAFESPAQREARARPPAPEPILATVDRGTLQDEITARADITRARTDEVIPQEVGDRAVVTARLLGPGARVRAGMALLVVSGRPLFVLPGRFGFYRDIVAGTTGPDVAQLQAGLAAARFPTAAGERGVYGPTTQQAVVALYRAAGSVPVTAPGRISAAARSAAKHAKRSVRAARVPIVPLTEVAVVDHLPARLVSSLEVGSKLTQDKPAATLASGGLVAHAGIASSVVDRIRPGMAARLVADSGRAVPARVLAVGGNHGSSTEELRDARLVATWKPIPAAWRASNVLARITTRLVRRNALIVPTRAIAHDAGGQDYVLKRSAAGLFVRVVVRPLGSLGGRTAVAPRAARALVAHDRVRVG
jgi:hypothetical protein